MVFAGRFWRFLRRHRGEDVKDADAVRYACVEEREVFCLVLWGSLRLISGDGYPAEYQMTGRDKGERGFEFPF